MKINTSHSGSTRRTLLFTGLALLLSIWLLAERGTLFSFLDRDAASVADTVRGGKTADSLFLSLMRSADKSFAAGNYDAALADYQKAQKMKPSDATLPGKISRTKTLAADRKKANDEYTAAIQSADSYFKAKDYLNAKAAYQVAINAKPDDAYAAGRLKETMNLLRSQKASNTLYDVAVASAEKLYQAKEYEKALAEFENASKILPTDKFAKDRINEIIRILTENKTKEEMYAQAIAAADKFYTAKKYADALPEYKNAASYKPEEKYPQDRIKEVTALLAAQKVKDEAYAKALALADKLFSDKSYPGSKTEYQNALKIKPEEDYPKSRIREIDDILAGKKRVQEDYDRLIAMADSLYIEKKYINAKSGYQQATKVKPAESYPKEMIAKADAKIAGMEASAKAIDEAYATSLAAADKYFAAKNYDPARTEYQNALTIKPGEKYPQDKIAEIGTILAALEKDKSTGEQYASLIADADQLLGEKSYLPSKEKYQAALKLKPAEAYPKEKIAEIDGVLADLAKQKDLESKYAASIQKADQLLTSKSYEPARTEYAKASALKPEEQYPKDRLAEIEKALADLAAQKALDDQYRGILTAADKLLAARSYDPARAEYAKALTLRPDDAYPKIKIAEIDKALALIAEQQSQEEQYQTAIQQADRLLTEKSYEPAKTEYQRALTIKPAEAYPKGKVAEIDKILAGLVKQKELDDQYAGLIGQADQLLTQKAYAEAKTKYQSAAQLKPAEEYPKSRIREIDVALADLAKQKALDDQYAGLIAKADQLLSAKSYDPARTQYEAASTIKPLESYPKERIAEIEKIKGDLAAQKALDDEYRGILTAADKLLDAKSYDPAKAEYNKALTLRPDDTYPKAKIAEIDKALALIAEQQSKEEQYQTAIKQADQLLGEKSFEPAKTEYQRALSIKPAEAYPKGKVAEIDKILAELARQKALDDQYTGFIAQADQLLAQKSYAEAKTKYQSASQLKPAEAYPKSRMQEIDAALADLAKQKALDDQYAGLIAKANQLLEAKSYDPAKVQYVAASELKPLESYPKEKIAEIDRALADIAAKKALDEQYTGIVQVADQFLAAKRYDDAKSEYAKALQLKPVEQYPKDRISEIDKALALIAEQKSKDEQYQAAIGRGDKLLADKSYELAKTEYQSASAIKPAELYPKTRITEIEKALAEIAKQKALDDEYTAAIGEGDRLRTAKSYDLAKVQYQKAAGLKPGEQYPKEKLAEIDKALAEIARLKAIDDQYEAAIGKADQALAEKSYEAARTGYQSATAIKPGEQYPKDKIAEIEKTVAELARKKALDDQYAAVIAGADKLLIAKTYDAALAEYQKASQLKPGETYPKEKMAEIGTIKQEIARLKELDEKYRSAIGRADQLLAAKSYEAAKTEYQTALALKSDEEYPKTKIAAIDKIFADQKALDDQYAAALAAGEKFMSEKSYDLAREQYLAAGRLKPLESLPKEKVTEVDKVKAEVARQKSIDDKYQAAIGRAEGLLTSKSYAQARTEFGNALQLKPAEQYPKDKMAEIDGILAELKARDNAYRASVAKADQLLAGKSYDEARTEYQNASSIKPDEQYPQNKITEITNILAELKGKKATYDELVLKGDNLFAAKDYYKAKDNFQQAQNLFPQESYPKERIGRITSVIDSIYRANKSFYDKAVADGDKYFTSLIFDKAIDAYTEAASFLPMETYPREMIAKIKKTIAENAIVDVLTTSQVISEGVDKQFPFAPVNMASRKNNYIYVKIKNLSKKPFNVLVRYGKDKAPSGGAVIKNLAPDGVVYDRLISVRDQDPWYREDNNWISLYPQGGDVEVSFIQISRSQ